MSMRERDTGDDIAIVGMAGTFPGAPDIAKFWADLCAGRDGITRMSRAELLAAGVEPELADDPAFVPAAGLLPDIDRFDADFFGYSATDAELLDPQHRLFLECAWHALEDGGIDPDRIDGPVGVFAGGAPSSYLLSNLLRDESAVLTHGPGHLVLQNEKDLIPSRLSYALDLTGPSVSVQSCSSTALTAVAQGCTSLLTGESDVVVAGAVSVIVPQTPGYLYVDGGQFSPDGTNRVLDAGANGKIPGDGVGVVVLRRLEDAQADGDRIYAVIRGWAVNHEGNQGRQRFDLPGVPGQTAVVAEALAAAGVDPAEVGHVEVGTMGTPFGDVAEISALQKVFDVDGVERVTLGSTDANLGHINQAGGIARLIKTALALHHGKLPPAVNFATPNPQLPLSGDKLSVVAELTDWPRGDRPRIAGVTAHGYGGADVHVVVEEAPEESREREAERPHQLLVWSARTPEAVAAATSRLAASSPEWTDLADVGYTLQFGRKAFEHRRMTVVSSPADAAEALASETRVLADAATVSRQAGFLLAGVGEQYAGMAGGLYATEPAFRTAIDECAELFRDQLGFDPVADLVGPRSAGGGDLARLLGRVPDTESAETTTVQPGVFAIDYALGTLLRAWGAEPAILAGYSVGEFAAAALAGSLTLPEATALVATRAQLISALPAGAMAAIPLSTDQLTRMAGDITASGLDIAAVNGPRMLVVSGPVDAVAELTEKLAAREVPARPLRTTHAFHSRALRPVAAELTAWARKNLKPRTPDTPYLSNVTGVPITGEQLADPGYWAEHMCRPVRFATMIAHIATQWPDAVLVELGAGQSLGSMFRGHPDFPQDRWARLVPSLPGEADPRPGTEVLTEALGRLWLSGVDIDWRAYHDGREPRKTTLPGYAFQRERYWIEPAAGLSGTVVPYGTRAAQPVYLVDGDVTGTGRALAVRLGRELGATVVFADEFGGPADQVAEAVRRAHGRVDGVLDLTTVKENR
ncbi:type I polyketide synthase [Kibdelosporangium persicum]|uniref:Phthiocerol synthesis polyketide synthase type I PpsE n=1 Tax=Kibdelosporangium persicum TaxID=2698649 RepID=A0ABX2FFC2_9PSEU|nr:type I polyketide synthase [Kibdelosporangium persicum]NRN69478.1 Phthiocerol synthesis polyketide synthase type I PpsE [Kibdelosporangium persicum]